MTYIVRLLGEFSGEWQYLTDPKYPVPGPAPWMPNRSVARHFATIAEAEAAKSVPWLNLNGRGNKAEIVDADTMWGTNWS